MAKYIFSFLDCGLIQRSRLMKMVKYCSKCGSEMNDNDRHCSGCGQGTPAERVQAYQVQKSNTGTKIAVAVVVGILLMAGVGYFFALKANHAYVAVYVHSTHITQTVEVFAFIDGEEVLYYDKLPPGNYTWTKYYQMVDFPLWESSKTIEVKAVSQGGGLGTQADSKILIVQQGEYYEVHLYV